MNTLISYEARQAIEVGRKHHWRFRVVDQTAYRSGWRFETLPQAPRTAQERLAALKAAGITYEGMIIAHEAPRLLAAPAKEDFKNTRILPESGTFIEAFTAAFAGALVLCFELFFELFLLDPAVIVVLEDGTWLEVMTWYE